jgi:hypothetical protein
MEWDQRQLNNEVLACFFGVNTFAGSEAKPFVQVFQADAGRMLKIPFLPERVTDNEMTVFQIDVHL